MLSPRPALGQQQPRAPRLARARWETCPRQPVPSGTRGCSQQRRGPRQPGACGRRRVRGAGGRGPRLPQRRRCAPPHARARTARRQTRTRARLRWNHVSSSLSHWRSGLRKARKYLSCRNSIRAQVYTVEQCPDSVHRAVHRQSDFQIGGCPGTGGAAAAAAVASADRWPLAVPPSPGARCHAAQDGRGDEGW